MDSEYVLDKCSEPCLQKLNCNDICRGTCGKCKQGRLHIPCSEICNKINPCNHICKFPCKERCPPCNNKCLYSCIHSKCTNICGKPCVPCKEKCSWKCRHLCCTVKCGEICNRMPCYEPCDLILECKHNCIGFCGEPCPPLCRICQKDEVTTIIFGNEDEPGARFVYLEDCGHSVESEALEQWMNQNDKEIVLKQCPLCRTPILKTLRFMNRVKVILKDIAEIKEKQYKEQFVISSNKIEMLQSLKSLSDNFKSIFIGDLRKFQHIKDLWDMFCKPLNKQFQISQKTHKNNRNRTVHIPIKEIESLDFVINLFKSTSKYKQIINEDIDDGPMKQTIINHFVWLLSVTFTYAKELSNQQKFDINMEMARGGRIVSLYKILSSVEYKMKVQMNIDSTNKNEVKDLIDNMIDMLISCKVYNLNRDKEIENRMELIEQKIDGIAFISDEERKMIHKAMSVNFPGGIRAQGHWCKCQNGHIYCITECGGPMEESVCPECKVKIGGRNHRYVSGVTVASEMDGARSLAWSSANNIGDYIFDD
ncbi:Zinc finger, RING-type [Cinara cedri]|uniref:Zinc finger, RING-type n=1 Tax=Cinara cedri TaxID=506608 RepID=A0A5E4N3M7_9HEMI|nr:Zinc finger, RING-type [Cinara cedri]